MFATADDGSQFDLKTIRKRDLDGMTQMQLAVAVGVHISTVAQWEQQRRAPEIARRLIARMVAERKAAA